MTCLSSLDHLLLVSFPVPSYNKYCTCKMKSQRLLILKKMFINNRSIVSESWLIAMWTQETQSFLIFPRWNSVLMTYFNRYTKNVQRCCRIDLYHTITQANKTRTIIDSTRFVFKYRTNKQIQQNSSKLWKCSPAGRNNS